VASKGSKHFGNDLQALICCRKERENCSKCAWVYVLLGGSNVMPLLKKKSKRKIRIERWEFGGLLAGLFLCGMTFWTSQQHLKRLKALGNDLQALICCRKERENCSKCAWVYVLLGRSNVIATPKNQDRTLGVRRSFGGSFFFVCVA